MPFAIEDREAQALGLPPEERARFVERLIASFEPKSAAQAAWMLLAQRRREEVCAGRTAMVPGGRTSACPSPGTTGVNYWLHPDAEAKLGDAAVYYAEHASLAVAEAFMLEF